MKSQMNFDMEMANEYDRGVRRTLPTYDAIFRLVQTYLRKHVVDNAEILVVGAGGGNELAILAPQNPSWAFTAVDPSEPMLELAKQKAKQFQLKNELRFIEGTIEDVDVTNEFDAATFMLVLHFIERDEEKLAQLKSIRKRLKKGASFVIATMFGDTESAEFDEQVALWKAYWLDATKLSEEEVNEMENTVRGLSFLPEGKIVEMLKEAGFGNIAKFFTTNMFGGWICKAK